MSEFKLLGKWEEDDVSEGDEEEEEEEEEIFGEGD